MPDLQLPDLKFLSRFDTAMNGKYFPKISATHPISPVITSYLKFWEMEEFLQNSNTDILNTLPLTWDLLT